MINPIRKTWNLYKYTQSYKSEKKSNTFVL
jgi:hypothetical protein